jgi:hypothetical protein
MGIELPPELADVAAQTGVKWPAADEDKMRQAAQTWRDTGKKLTTLIKDADTSAQSALHTTSGASADAARQHWNGYVKPDTGHLTKVAHGCTQAADQLDHAANQVGEAKLAIVRNLVPLANHKDVAQHAAAAGSPTALLGLDTAVKGTAANVADVHKTLVTAVQPTTGVVVDATHTLVDPTPGAHGHRPDLVQGVTNTVAPGAQHLVQGTQNVLDPSAGHGHTAPGLAVPVLDGSPLGHGGPVLDGPGGMGGHGVPVLDGPGAGHGGGMGHGGMDPSTGVSGPPGVEPVTGPIPLPAGHGYDLPSNAPTPPTGIPVVQDHTVHAAAAAPAVLDAPSPAQAPPPVAQGPVSGGPVAGGSPVVGGGPQFVTGGPPPSAAPVAPVGGGTSPAPSPVAAPVPAQRGAAPAMVSVDPVRQFGPGQQQSPAAAISAHSLPAKDDQSTILAIWLVRMFPIGHMPVAAARPARQLPPPSPDYDYAPGMRFEPHDHPHSDLVPGMETVPVEPSAPIEDAVVDGLAVGYDSLGGENERDWDRRFVVRPGTGRDTMDIEYAWPPSELFPEGATAPGEPEVLLPGTQIDRFGTPEGRVFAADSTAFDRRSLPPSHLRAGYRRYRVLRPLPVWRGISAAWFAQPGGGVRYRTIYPAHDLVALGYLTEEVIDES